MSIAKVEFRRLLFAKILHYTATRPFRSLTPQPHKHHTSPRRAPHRLILPLHRFLSHITLLLNNNILPAIQLVLLLQSLEFLEHLGVLFS